MGGGGAETLNSCQTLVTSDTECSPVFFGQFNDGGNSVCTCIKKGYTCDIQPSDRRGDSVWERFDATDATNTADTVYVTDMYGNTLKYTDEEYGNKGFNGRKAFTTIGVADGRSALYYGKAQMHWHVSSLATALKRGETGHVASNKDRHVASEDKEEKRCPDSATWDAVDYRVSCKKPAECPQAAWVTDKWGKTVEYTKEAKGINGQPMWTSPGVVGHRHTHALYWAKAGGHWHIATKDHATSPGHPEKDDSHVEAIGFKRFTEFNPTNADTLAGCPCDAEWSASRYASYMRFGPVLTAFTVSLALPW